MLPIGDLPQDKRPTQTESEGLETNIPRKWTGKKSWGNNIHIRQNRLQKKSHKRRPRRSLHNTQGAPKYIKKILEDFKKDVDRNTLIGGDFNTLLSKMDRFSKQNINKDIVALNNALDQTDLTDI